MKLRFMVISLLSLLNLTSCVQFLPPEPRIPFPVAEYENLLKTGSATVKGRAYVTSKNKITIAAKQMELIPVTSYSRQWYEKSYKKGIELTGYDQREMNYVKVDDGLEDGHFIFENVAPGEYYLAGLVYYKEPSYIKNGTSMHRKVLIVDKINVKDGSEMDASFAFDLLYSIQDRDGYSNEY